MEHNQKITAAHLKRRAVLYIRQSTMKQVIENTESTVRQYALKNRLVALGWAEESITVIDCDLGLSGADAEGRDGFKQLVADVGSGEAGAVACIECSRLSRNSNDWGRLMEICVITKTVLIDADGIYDPNDFNDRILLGLKGTISEAELHFIKARMAGGRLSKARRGELRTKLPVGYVYDGAGRAVKNPDAEIRGAVQLLFDAFTRTGTAHGTVAFFRENGHKFPVDHKGGFERGEVQWKPLAESKVLSVLHNPFYAGVYSYGKKHYECTLDGKKRKATQEDEWLVRLEDHHEGYISAAEHRGNIARLKANSSAKSGSVPREGFALLQGMAVCGKCGSKMQPRYYSSGNGEKTYYYYSCKTGRDGDCGMCQSSVKGPAVDKAVSDIVLETLTPLAISAAIEVEQESRRRKAASDNYFLMQVDRARYELELAKSRYMNVDPSNRLVAFELESLWNARIVDLARAEEEMNRHNREKNTSQGSLDCAGLDGLAGDVHEIWHSDKIRIQDRKRILRCLLEDVTITKGEATTTIGILFKTGAVRSVECENSKPVYIAHATENGVIDYIREKSSTYSSREISDTLNKEGFRTGTGAEFTPIKVRSLMKSHSIPSLAEQLREQGYLFTNEKASLLGVSPYILGKLRDQGEIDCEWKKVDGKSMYMYAPV